MECTPCQALSAVQREKILDMERTPGDILNKSRFGDRLGENRSGRSMTITQESKKYDISVDTLRYYERIGLIPPVPRTSSGVRD